VKYRWSIAPAQPALTCFLSGELRISQLLAQCLLNRGFSEPGPIQYFLEPRLKNLSDPFLLPGMASAVDRLFEARAREEPIVLFGDYDVDGVTSTALLYELLGTLGWKVETYLPHRMDEGYGLTQVAIENCVARHACALLIAVDCGSTAVTSVDWLRQRPVDVIVLDHHQISSPAPSVVALVNPQVADPGGAGLHFRELCSVGLAFKLAHAVVKRGRQLGLAQFASADVREFLDLVALGTIADLVPLVGENRILVTAGLERLRVTKRPGLIALKKAASINGRVGGYEVGFQLAPRLNAAGRLETAEEALSLLLAPDLATAEPIALRLDARNRERQKIEKCIVEEVLASVRMRFQQVQDWVIVEAHPSWHIGVVGIVASRVLQEYHRPTLVLGGEGEEWRGSGRSINGFDLAAALRHCTDLLIRHGGHAMAAGISIRPDNLDAFRTRLNELARRTLTPEQLQPVLQIDASAVLPDLTFDGVRELSRLEQTGIGNPSVRLLLCGLSHARPLQRVGLDRKHAKLWITDGRATREAVMWGVGDGSLPVGKFDLVVEPRLHEFNETISVQLKVVDWRPNPHSK
jgi:single-stranded-DNA-specific exonuclease